MYMSVVGSIDLLEIFAVILLVDGSVHVLMSEEFEDQW